MKTWHWRHWHYLRVPEEGQIAQVCHGHFFALGEARATFGEQIFIGRLAVVFAILTFAATYSGGILYYGWWLGIALGWIPSLAFALLAASAIEQIGQILTQGMVQLRKCLAAVSPAAKIGGMQKQKKATHDS